VLQMELYAAGYGTQGLPIRREPIRTLNSREVVMRSRSVSTWRYESCQQAFVKRTPGLVANPIIMPLHGKAHWSSREAPEEVNVKVLPFLDTARDGRLVSKSIVPVNCDFSGIHKTRVWIVPLLSCFFGTV
jgi:hypothetical protein